MRGNIRNALVDIAGFAVLVGLFYAFCAVTTRKGADEILDGVVRVINML